jgi:outer membrane receptor for ferrienterochelin and colicins
MSRRAFFAAVAFALAGAAGVARAEDPKPGAKADSKKDDGDVVVVTGTRTPERSQRATVKTDVITREEAERRGATNVAEALAAQPGLVVNPGSYGFLGGVSALQIQGFDRDRVLILEDGERIVGDVGGAIDLSALPIGDIERIEVVTGPTSSLYGSAALGGVVNIITAPPKYEGSAGRARFEGRTFSGLLAQGSASYKRGRFWAGADLDYFRQDPIQRQDDLPDTRIPEIHRRMLGLKGGMQITDRMDVRLRARAFHDTNDGVQSQLVPNLGRFVIDLPEKTDRYTLHLIHVTKFKNGSQLRLTLGRQWFDNTTAEDRRDSPIDVIHERHHRMQSFEGVGTIADGARTWVAGARFEAEHFEQSVTRTDSTAAGPVTTTAPEVLPLGYGTAAAYAQLSWKLGPVTAMPGVRVEEHTRYGGNLAPRLAAAWRPNDLVIARASVGRGYRAPSAKELGFLFDHSVFGYRVKGNANLNPEKSWGTNADVTVTPTKRISVRGGVFANWVEDLIDLDLANGQTVGPGVIQYAYTNFGKARTAGAELFTTFTPTWWLRTDASYSYTWTRDDTNDRPLPGRPPHSVTLAIRVEPVRKAEVVARARVVTSAFLDETPATATRPATTLRAPGYETLDGRIGYAVLPRSQLYGGVLNVLDIKQDPGRVGDTRPPLGRIFYVGFRAEFPWEDPE